jgi:hypothetical protein
MTATRKARWIVVYIDAKNRRVEVRIRRARDRTLGARVYVLDEGDPSLHRLEKLLYGHDYTSYAPNIGWGVTNLNGRARRIYHF